MIANNLKKVINELGISQRQFAMRIGTDPGYISKMLNDKVEINERMLLLIENVFNVNRRFLEFGEGEMFKTAPAPSTKDKILGIIDTLDENQINSVAAFLKFLKEK